MKSTLAFLDEFSNLPSHTTSLDTSAPHQDSEVVVKFPFDDISESVGVPPVEDTSSVIPDETGSFVAALPEPTKLTQSGMTATFETLFSQPYVKIYWSDFATVLWSNSAIHSKLVSFDKNSSPLRKCSQ